MKDKMDTGAKMVSVQIIMGEKTPLILPACYKKIYEWCWENL